MNSSLPNEITRPVQTAQESVQAHSGHLLLPFYRRAIYKAIDEAGGRNAHAVKAMCGILAAEFVIPYWRIPLFMVEEGETEYDYWLHLPSHLVETAKGILSRVVDREEALKELRHLSEVKHFTGQMDNSPYYHEWCAFESALSCAWEALDPDSESIVNSGDGITRTTTDRELEQRADPALLACLAYAGGSWKPASPDQWLYDSGQNRWISHNRNWYFEEYGIWDRDTSTAIARRQEFWQWWLSQAVVTAWRQFQ